MPKGYYMIINTKINNKYYNFDLRTFQEFYDKFIWLLENVNSKDLNALKSSNFNSDIVKNRFKKFWEENKDNKVSVRKIKYDCSPKSFSNKTKEFYLDRGWSEEYAIEKISEIQRSNSKKSAEKMTDDRLTSQIGYWLKQGFSEEESQKKVSERQSTFTLERCVEKYGEEKGKEKWEERQSKWQKTLNERYNLEEMLEWKKKGFLSTKSASKEAVNLFLPFYKEYKDIYKCFLYTEGSKEFILKDESLGHCYFYDFTIEDLKLIFEYNGEHVHPNPDWDKEKWNSWRHCYSRKTADEIYSKYKIKIRFAEQNGYKIIQLWSSTPKKENKQIIRDEILARVQAHQQLHHLI